METVAHGVDLVDCGRLAEAIDRHGQRFLERVYTAHELAYCEGKKRRLEHLAGRFAAKEAVLKVLGTGWREGIAWTDIEVRNDVAGKPEIVLGGRCAEIAAQQGLATILISISHIATHAIASAIGLRAARAAGEGS